MTTLVQIDGQIVAPDRATVSVFDRGFLYGDSVFETIRTYGGRPFALDEHLKRLEHSAGLVYIELPVTLQQLRRETLLAVSQAGNPESYVRLMVTRGQGELGLDPALAGVARRVIIVSELHPLPPRWYEVGARAVSFRTQRAHDATPAQGAKIGNYLVAVLAMREAKKSGALEALVVNAEGRVVEGATSNVFYLKAGTLMTPPLDSGILPGITREHVLGAAQSLGCPVRFACPRLEELQAADEVFVSSSIRELLPIVEIDGQQIGAGRPGAVTRQLHAEFRRQLDASMEQP